MELGIPGFWDKACFLEIGVAAGGGFGTSWGGGKVMLQARRFSIPNSVAMLINLTVDEPKPTVPETPIMSSKRFCTPYSPTSHTLLFFELLLRQLLRLLSLVVLDQVVDVAEDRLHAVLVGAVELEIAD